MVNETFRSIQYSDETLFVHTNNRIELKEYNDDIVLYSPFDANLNAKYCIGNAVAVTTGTPTLMNFGQFSQCVDLTGSITYDATNFATLADQGSIKFWLKATFNNAFGYQDFVATTISAFAAGTYKFTLTVGNNLPIVISVPLVGTESMTNIYSTVASNLTGSHAHGVFVNLNQVRIQADNLADTILIAAPPSGLNLVTLLGGVSSAVIANAPLNDTTLFSSKGATNNNRIDLIHKATTSNIVLQMYDSSGVLKVNSVLGVWNNSYLSFYSFELSFNETMVQLFIGGKLLGMAITGFARQVQSDATFELNWNGVDEYKFDELIIYNVYKHISNYTVETTALTQYTTTTPYIDVLFGDGFVEGTISGMSVEGSNTCNYVVQIGNQWYYYINGSWRYSDGSFAQSISGALIETKFPELFFDETLDLTIRVYFESDGSTPCYIDDITIQVVQDDNKTAVITGTVSVNSPVDLSIDNRVMIKTDQGGAEVILTSACINPAAVTMNELKAAINNAHIPGLNLVKDDSKGHLVLESTNTGSNAYISIDNGSTADALPLIWGYDTIDTGKDSTIPPLDYSPIYDYIRSRLGAPIVPVELTDQQLENLLAETATEYNRWRNYREQLLYLTLAGNSRDGYDIPAIIGDSSNIIDIIVKPHMPFGYYSADTDMASNLYMQYLFQKYGRPGQVGFLSDYWLALSTEKDMNLILGTEVRWNITNRKIFMTPAPKASLQVGIQYRAALTVNELLSDNLVRRYMLALAKILLGNIRGTFGGAIPGGTENIQLNSAELIAQGKEELAEAKQEMHQQTEMPTMLIG